MKEQFIIRWKQLNSETFMYGSTVRFVDNSVQFHNALMPSATVIHTWKMKTQFGSDRAIPSLPFLKRNFQYDISFDMQTVPDHTAYFVITFFRRNDTVIERKIVKEKYCTFIYPKDAYHYQIELLSSSVESLTFNKITIQMSE